MADAGNGRIVQMDDFSGAGWTSFTYPRTNTSLIAPFGIAVDSQGRIYATNPADDNISRIDDITGKDFTTFGRSGSGVGEFGGVSGSAEMFGGPLGIAVDSQDRLYVADSDNGRIVRVNDVDGAGWTSLGTPGIGRDQFLEPQDIALDSRGRINVADRQNGRIVRVDDMAKAGWTTYGTKQTGVRPGTFDLLGGIGSSEPTSSGRKLLQVTVEVAAALFIPTGRRPW